MLILDTLLEDMCEALTGVRSTDHNIIRVHTRKLKELGDLSFPLDTKNWYRFIDKGYTQNKNTIFECLVCQEELQEKSKLCPLSIQNIAINNGNVAVYLNKEEAFRVVINSVLNQTTKYGSENSLNRNVYVLLPLTDYLPTNLTELKIHLLQKVISKIAMFLNSEPKDQVPITLKFTSGTGAGRNNFYLIPCGPVLNENCSKDFCTTTEQLYQYKITTSSVCTCVHNHFFSKRIADMRLMALHKYGVRATTQAGWKEFFEKLGKAAVTIQFTQNKPQHTTVVKLNDPENIRGNAYICKQLFFILTGIRHRCFLYII